MEYFSSKYLNYSPKLPSDIINELLQSSERRLLPSEGLTILQIAHALKSFGFGTVHYAKDKDKDPNDKKNFHRLMYYYVESGIPIVVALQKDNSAHALIYIGHSPINIEEELTRKQGEKLTDKLNIIYTADLCTRYIVIDDNFPPYQETSLDQPGSYYTSKSQKEYQITGFVVPLYKRIHLEASQAHKLAIEILKDSAIGYSDSNKNIELIFRFFLTSSRSFKRSVLRNEEMHVLLKQFLLRKTMPKFIWVAELSSKELYKQEKGNGLIVLDATGDKSFNSLLFAYYPNRIALKKEMTQELKTGLGNFNLYKNNLKGEWSQWK